MPPIMGAGGFIMAELIGVPYSKIMLVAMFPAFILARLHCHQGQILGFPAHLTNQFLEPNRVVFMLKT